MNNENDPNIAQIGLYRDPESGKELGAIHEAQAAAMVRQGWKLVPGADPYKLTSEMVADENERSASLPDEKEQSTTAQKGKK